MVWLLSGLVVMTPVGCGGGAVSTPTTSMSAKLQAMASLYSSCVTANKGRPPQDESAFREYLNTKQDVLQPAGLTVDEVFVSPRSSQPLQWVYGKMSRGNHFGMKIVAYEIESDDAKRLVIASNGVYDYVDESQFRQVFPSASK